MTRPYLLIVVFVACLCIVPSEAANARLELNPGAPSSTVHYNLVEQGKAQMAAALVESVFALPEGQLSPVYGYEDIQHAAVVAHLSSPNTRFVVLNKRSRYGPFVFTPWMIQRSPREPWLRSLLFLQVLPTGEIVPMGFAAVQEGIPPLHKKGFWETVQKAATMLQPDIMSKYGIRRMITPVF